MTRFFTILILLVTGMNMATASSKDIVTITGHVNAADGESIHASVFLKDTKIGTTTDEKGDFSFKAAVGKYILVVSAVGYETYEEEFTAKKGINKFQIDLFPEETKLEGATLVAKSQSRIEREKGFALSSVDTKKAALRNFETSELLNRTSGVKLRQSGGAGSDIQYNINGMSGNSIRIFIDGVPMENYGASFSVASLPSSMIERIDVYKGVVPAHLTDDALGGAINIILKEPTSRSISTSYTYGSFNTHKWDLNGSYRHSKTGFTLQGSAFFNHSDNNYKVWGDQIKVTDPQTGRVEHIKAERFHDRYQSKGINLNLGVSKVKWADRFMFGFIYSDMMKEIQHGATMEVVYGNRHSKQHTYMGKFQYEKTDLIIPNLDLSVNVSYAAGNRRVVDTLPYMYTWKGEIMTDREGNPVKWHKGGGEAGRATLATNLENTLTGRARLAYSFLPKHNVSANFMYDKFTRDVNDPYLTEAEQRFTDTRHLNKAILSVAYDGKFLNDKLQTNLFYKYYWQYVGLTDPMMQNGELVAQKISRDIDDHGVGGSISFRAHRHVLITGSVEYATRLPGVTELLGNTTNNIEATYDLRPEKSVNVNLGAIIGNFQFGDHGFEADVNFFFRDIRDMIQKSLTNLTDEMYGFENLGKVQGKGVDVDLKYNFKHRLMSDFKLSYNDTRFNLRYDQHGTEYIYYRDRLRNEPFFTFNWNVEYSLPLKRSKLNFSYNMSYVHEFFRNWESLGGAGKAVIPTQFVNDFGVLYTFYKNRFAVGADVKNIFNEQVYDNWALQKPGRMFFIKLSYTFNK